MSRQFERTKNKYKHLILNEDASVQDKTYTQESSMNFSKRVNEDVNA